MDQAGVADEEIPLSFDQGEVADAALLPDGELPHPNESSESNPCLPRDDDLARQDKNEGVKMRSPSDLGPGQPVKPEIARRGERKGQSLKEGSKHDPAPATIGRPRAAG